MLNNYKLPIKINFFRLRLTYKNIFLTFIAEAIVLIAFFFIYRLIGNNFGPEGVGEYSLVKRVIGFLEPLLLLGLGMGIPRYIAMSHSKEERSVYIKSGTLIVMFLTFIFLIFTNLFKEYFAKIFFGDINYVNLILPLSFLMAGLVLYGLVYSYFRGRLLVKTFNFLQIINLALVPLIILIFFRNITIDKFISLTGIVTFIISFIFSLFFIKEIFPGVRKLELKNSFKNLLYYSVSRIPSSFALAGFFSLGPIFAVHFTSIREVGYFSVSQSLLSAVGTVIAPLGLILLPKISNMIAHKRDEEIKENLNHLIGASIQLSIFLCLQLIIFADLIIKNWLGLEFLDAVPVMRIAFCSLFFYFFFRAVASILDAAEVKPINTINLFISLGIFLIASGILLFLFNLFSPIISLSISFALGIVCLGVLTYISIRKLYPEKTGKDLRYFAIAMGINIIIGSMAILVRPFTASGLHYLIFFEVLITMIYLLILWLLKMDWLKQIPEKILLKSL